MSKRMSLMAAIRKEALMDGNDTSRHVREQKTGLKCPRCGNFIETSIFQLLTTTALICPSCHLRLNIDRLKSKRAFDALRKVKAAQDNLESKSKFNR